MSGAQGVLTPRDRALTTIVSGARTLCPNFILLGRKDFGAKMV